MTDEEAIASSPPYGEARPTAFRTTADCAAPLRGVLLQTHTLVADSPVLPKVKSVETSRAWGVSAWLT